MIEVDQMLDPEDGKPWTPIILLYLLLSQHLAGEKRWDKRMKVEKGGPKESYTYLLQLHSLLENEEVGEGSQGS